MRRKLGFAGEVSTDVTYGAQQEGEARGSLTWAHSGCDLPPESSLSTSDLECHLCRLCQCANTGRLPYAKVELESELTPKGSCGLGSRGESRPPPHTSWAIRPTSL